MAYVDKLKIDNNSYDIKDTEGRAETAKKIDKDTAGDLAQTVSGKMSVQSVDRLTLDSEKDIFLSQNGIPLN